MWFHSKLPVTFTSVFKITCDNNASVINKSNIRSDANSAKCIRLSKFLYRFELSNPEAKNPLKQHIQVNANS